MSDELKYIGESQRDEHDKPTKTKKVMLFGWDTENLQAVRLAVTPDGQIQTDTPLSSYTFADTSTSGDITYLGNLRADGAWYIKKYDKSAGTMRYTKGSSNYPTNWINKASLSYDYYDVVF